MRFVALTHYITQKASRSNKILAMLVVVLVLNFFIPDVVPFVDELVSIPVIIAIVSKLSRDADKEKWKNSKTKKVIEGEFVD